MFPKSTRGFDLNNGFAIRGRQKYLMRRGGLCGVSSKYLALTVTDRFGPTVGSKLIKPSGNKRTSWSDCQVDRIKTCSRLHVARSSPAPWRLPSVARSRRRVARSRQALRASRVVNSLRSRVHSGVPSSLSPQPNRAPKAAMDSSSYGAHADMLGARFGLRAAEDEHLTFLRAHAAVAHVGCCSCHPLNACKCHRGLQGPCIERGPCVDYLQDRALIKQNLGQTVGE
jgi:hypothetical protein